MKRALKLSLLAGALALSATPALAAHSEGPPREEQQS